ncbi:MAG: CRISPR-associated protein Cas5 [Burkholderiaceae bacterium]
MKRYPVEFEIAGPAAMFSRPDTGAAPVSYPVPTWSACKAMFEAVARGFVAKNIASAFFCPTSVEIRRPIRFERYVTNYRGPLRKSSQIEKQASYQLQATILVDVCYRVRGETVQIPGAADGGVSAAHALQAMFNRRLAGGVSKYPPCLGWKEFLPSYFGPFLEAPEWQALFPLQHEESTQLPAFLLAVWDAPVNGDYRPVFRELQIEAGTLRFPRVSLANGKLVFEEEPHAG